MEPSVIAFSVIVVAGIAYERWRSHQRASKLEGLARELGVKSVGTNELSYDRADLDVTARLLSGEGTHPEKLTEITAPLPARYPLTIDLRRARSGDATRIQTGRVLDLELGDPAFDDLFLLQAAPSDVVRTLLDPEARALLVTVPEVHLETVDGTLRLRLPGWVEDRRVLEELTALVGRMAAGVRAAFAQDVPTSVVGEPYRERPDASEERALAERREREVSRIEELVPLRHQQERADERWIWIGIGLAVAGSWAIGRLLS